MRTCIRYFSPYAQVWREQWFPTISEAEAMVEFYKSCGSPAHIVWHSMVRRKHLTFKSPNKMNLFALLIVLLCIISPIARHTVGSAFIWIGDALQGEIKWVGNNVNRMPSANKLNQFAWFCLTTRAQIVITIRWTHCDESLSKHTSPLTLDI